jgi:aminoglycoside phosphotransferase (APT) family kinase protein
MSPMVSIDADLVRRLVARRFPEWAELTVVPVSTQGVDNATFRLGADKLVRLPRYERWVGQVTREQRWLPRLAPHLPLTVPEPLAGAEPDAGFPYPWSVYRWLDGERADRAPVADPLDAAVRLARFLVALRGVDATGGPDPEWSNGFRGVGVDDDRDSPIVAWRVEEKIAALAGLVDTDALRAVWAAGRAVPPWPGSPVWVHGDPAPGNLLTTDGRLSAVIDFGTLAVGDPACDLIAAWAFVPRTARDAFRAEVGLDDATWARGRVWGLVSVLPDPDALTDVVRERIDELVADLGS